MQRSNWRCAVGTLGTKGGTLCSRSYVKAAVERKKGNQSWKVRSLGKKGSNSTVVVVVKSTRRSDGMSVTMMNDG